MVHKDTTNIQKDGIWYNPVHIRESYLFLNIKKKSNQYFQSRPIPINHQWLLPPALL